MHPIVHEHLDELTACCAKYRVQQLELFGSATREDFDPCASDLDFLVEFLPLGPGEHAKSYFGLRSELEEIFERPVDLVMTRAIRNRFFLEAVNQSRAVVYAA